MEVNLEKLKGMTAEQIYKLAYKEGYATGYNEGHKDAYMQQNKIFLKDERVQK